jgi:hypothetical protein
MHLNDLNIAGLSIERIVRDKSGMFVTLFLEKAYKKNLPASELKRTKEKKSRAESGFCQKTE